MSDTNGSGDHLKSADEAKERRKSRFLRHNKSRERDHEKDKEERGSPNGSKPTSNEFKIEELLQRRDSHGHDDINTKPRSGSASNSHTSPRKMAPPPHIPLNSIVRDYHTDSAEHKVTFDADLNSSEDVSAMESFSEASFSEKSFSFRERSGTTDTIDTEARKKRARAKHYRYVY